MLREIPNVRQIPGDGRRRWFTDAYFDLIIWYEEGGAVSGFQLCYDKHGHERAFTWRKGHRLVHEGIDTGELPRHSKKSPVLGGSPAPARGIEKRFFLESANIDDREIVRLVRDRIDEYLHMEEVAIPHERETRPPKDPVCGRRLNRDAAYAVVRYDGVEYLLCSPKCQSEFEADPERYEATSLVLNRLSRP